MEFDTYTDWSPFNFFRPAAWRMGRAAQRIQFSLPPDPMIDDAWVARAIALRADTFPDLSGQPAYAAHEVWKANRSPRWLLEAYLLTDLAIDEVARECSLPTAVVEAYHELFFDVRGKLQARDWIVSQVILSAPNNHFAGPQPAGIWKYYAYTGGPYVLEVVVAVTQGVPLPQSWLGTFKINPTLEEQLLRLKYKLMIAIARARTNRQFAAVAKLYQRVCTLSEKIGLPVPKDDERIALYTRLLTLESRTRPRLDERSSEPKSPDSGPNRTLLHAPPDTIPGDRHDQKFRWQNSVVV
jgi:hypothetical protein